jgi:hypothetical protein
MEERPRGWGVCREYRLFSRREARLLGFQSQVDVLLQAPDGRRVAVELEVSRDDLVVNHAKMLLAYARRVLEPGDVFVSMVSTHVKPRRRKFGAALASCMRAGGMPAFHVALLPMLAPAEVQRSNHDEGLSRELALEHAKGELERVLCVVEPRGEREHRIHFAGAVEDVLANCCAWNEEMKGAGAELWKRRSAQFFVADPRLGLFAPSKFCAFLPAWRGQGPPPPQTMTLQVYASLGEQDPRFDGNIAHKHLVRRLGFHVVEDLGGLGMAAGSWVLWCDRLGKRLTLRRPVRWLMPAEWYWR